MWNVRYNNALGVARIDTADYEQQVSFESWCVYTFDQKLPRQ